MGLAPADTLQAHFTHQPLHGAAAHRDPFALQLALDLAGAVDPEALGMDPGDLGLELTIGDGSSRSGSASDVVVGGRGNPQDLQIGATPNRSL